MVHVTPAARNEIQYVAPPPVNVMPFVNDEFYCHVPPPSESVGFYVRVDNFQDQCNVM